MKEYLVVIPARLKSKRLPNKPLIKLKKIPMIVRTFNQCKKAIPLKNIIVATDSSKIIDVCKNYSIPNILVEKKCLTGTDRVAEVAKKMKAKIYINLQGDEPIFSPRDIRKFLAYALKNKKLVINGYSKIYNKNEYKNLSIPKLVFNKKKELIYMSRSPIPGNKMNVFNFAWKQICIYSFPRNILLNLKKNKNKTPLEKIEDIEILRFLENGITVKMLKLSGNSFAVDTFDDLKKVLKKI